MSNSFTHTDKKGRTRMVDVSHKRVTSRRAVAEGKVELTTVIANAIRQNAVAKGNVLEVARIAAIQAAKKTSELVPLCHPIPLTGIHLEMELENDAVRIRAEVKADAKTGAEMEALTAVSVAALVIYDMCKGMDKGMRIESIQLVEKEGGKSGHYRRASE